MSAVDKCCLPHRDNLMEPIHMHLSQKLTNFFNFILHFRNLSEIFDIFRKNMTLIPYLFLRLRPGKIVGRYVCKKCPFRLPFQKEHGKLVSNLFKFERQHLHHIYWSTGRKLSCKKSLLVIWESFRLFVNTMNAVEKCSLPNRGNLMQPIQMQLSQKLKTFCNFILHFRNLG